MRRNLTLVLLTFLLGLTSAAACSSDDDSDASSATEPTTGDTTASSATEPTTGDTQEPLPTPPDPPPPDLDEIFAPAETLTGVAASYCDAWPAVEELLSPEPTFVDVPDAGWSSDHDDPPAGAAAFTAAVEATGWTGVDCGQPVVVSGDWVAIPANPVRTDGSGEEGIWTLRVTGDGVHWHLAYGTAVETAGPAPTTPDPQLAAEAEAFCDVFEDVEERGSNTVLPVMTEEPAVYNIPNGNSYEGNRGIREMMLRFPDSDAYRCGDTTATNGLWSAQGADVFNPVYRTAVAGVQVQLHTEDGLVDRQYPNFTQYTGTGNWGVPIEAS